MKSIEQNLKEHHFNLRVSVWFDALFIITIVLAGIAWFIN